MITVSIDSKNLNRRLKRVRDKLDKGSTLTVQEVGSYTRDNIIRFMPKDTGESARSIVYKVQKNTPEEKEVIIGRAFDPHPEKRWGTVWFNLPRWMFDSPNAIKHFRYSDGDIMSMRSVPGMAEVKFKTKINNLISEIKTIR
jgi:hypothetical protein